LLDRRWTERRALLFYIWVAAFTALNVVNYCSPGWCETIGFPFAWRAWSDSILMLEDRDFGQVVMEKVGPAVAALLDLFAFVTVARVVTSTRRPEADRHPGGPSSG
jgi:hypothetical protein